MHSTCFGCSFSPLKMISPLSGPVIWLIIRIKEVFPAPFGPTNPNTDFSATAIEISFKATWLLYRLDTLFILRISVILENKVQIYEIYHVRQDFYMNGRSIHIGNPTAYYKFHSICRICLQRFYILL